MFIRSDSAQGIDISIQRIQKNLCNFPRTYKSLAPTPVVGLEKISKQFEKNVFCKRDDLTGFALGGNKSRHLDFLIGEAEFLEANTLIAIGDIHSNFCRVAAAFGSAHSMDVHLVLGGKYDGRPQGNMVINNLLGATCHFVEGDDIKSWQAVAAQIKEQLMGEGKRVYNLPLGGSSAIGALGYVNGFAEILRDQDRVGSEFDLIVHATGAGGTQAGLVVGKCLSDWRGKIIGISTSEKTPAQRAKVFRVAQGAAGLLGCTVSQDDVKVDDRFYGEGYGKRTTAATTAIDMFAKDYGIFLDHNYSGKAAAGLLQILVERPERTILFIHTGGTPTIFTETADGAAG